MGALRDPAPLSGNQADPLVRHGPAANTDQLAREPSDHNTLFGGPERELGDDQAQPGSGGQRDLGPIGSNRPSGNCVENLASEAAVSGQAGTFAMNDGLVGRSNDTSLGMIQRTLGAYSTGYTNANQVNTGLAGRSNEITLGTVQPVLRGYSMRNTNAIENSNGLAHSRTIQGARSNDNPARSSYQSTAFPNSGRNHTGFNQTGLNATATEYHPLGFPNSGRNHTEFNQTGLNATATEYHPLGFPNSGRNHTEFRETGLNATATEYHPLGLPTGPEIVTIPAPAPIVSDLFGRGELEPFQTTGLRLGGDAVDRSLAERLAMGRSNDFPIHVDSEDIRPPSSYGGSTLVPSDANTEHLSAIDSDQENIPPSDDGSSFIYSDYNAFHPGQRNVFSSRYLSPTRSDRNNFEIYVDPENRSSPGDSPNNQPNHHNTHPTNSIGANFTHMDQNTQSAPSGGAPGFVQSNNQMRAPWPPLGDVPPTQPGREAHHTPPTRTNLVNLYPLPMNPRFPQLAEGHHTTPTGTGLEIFHPHPMNSRFPQLAEGQQTNPAGTNLANLHPPPTSLRFPQLAEGHHTTPAGTDLANFHSPLRDYGFNEHGRNANQHGSVDASLGVPAHVPYPPGLGVRGPGLPHPSTQPRNITSDDNGHNNHHMGFGNQLSMAPPPPSTNPSVPDGYGEGYPPPHHHHHRRRLPLYDHQPHFASHPLTPAAPGASLGRPDPRHCPSRPFASAAPAGVGPGSVGEVGPHTWTGHPQLSSHPFPSEPLWVVYGGLDGRGLYLSTATGHRYVEGRFIAPPPGFDFSPMLTGSARPVAIPAHAPAATSTAATAPGHHLPPFPPNQMVHHQGMIDRDRNRDRDQSTHGREPIRPPPPPPPPPIGFPPR